MLTEGILYIAEHFSAQYVSESHVICSLSGL